MRNLVTTKNGTLQGTAEDGVLSFKGVPYAKPPVGEFRFRPAQPAEPWDGVRDATEYGPVSPQRNRLMHADEDCLTLNIWTPQADGGKRPVMFYIHGGSFCGGAGSDPEYHGARLSKKGDVVVVSVNYRLGVLGFLDFSWMDKRFSANCGLSDIVEALRWVYGNVERFGGDPRNITVFGQSAGAIAASVLPVMPSARKYVARVIMMSGGPSLLYTREEYQEISRKFLRFAKISTAEELLAIPAEKLVRKQKKFASCCGLGDGTFMIEVDGALVPDYPIPAAARGGAQDIPILIGTTKEEMSFLCTKLLSRILDIKTLLQANMDWEKEETKKRLQKAYERYGKRAQSMMITDRVFRMASVWYAEVYNRYAQTWMYRFDYETPAMKLTKLHACHSSDIPFVFGNYKAGWFRWMFLFSPPEKTCRHITEEMQRDFLTFAHGRQLPWQPCRGRETPAKCYDNRCSVVPMVDPEIEREYEKSEFKKRSFRSFAFGAGKLR